MKTVKFNKNNSIFLKIREKVILVVAMATEVAIKIFTIIFLVLSDNNHSVKVSSNSEMGPGQLFLVLSENWCLKYYPIVYTRTET